MFERSLFWESTSDLMPYVSCMAKHQFKFSLITSVHQLWNIAELSEEGSREMQAQRACARIRLPE